MDAFGLVIFSIVLANISGVMELASSECLRSHAHLFRGHSRHANLRDEIPYCYCIQL